MRIEVIDEDGSATAQARAYAEYRLFTTLARHAGSIGSVRAVLGREPKRATCVVNVELKPSGSAVARAFDRHVYGAIDQAAERIGDRINRKPLQVPSGPL